jgi:hypothetical protein
VGVVDVVVGIRLKTVTLNVLLRIYRYIFVDVMINVKGKEKGVPSNVACYVMKHDDGLESSKTKTATTNVTRSFASFTVTSSIKSGLHMYTFVVPIRVRVRFVFSGESSSICRGHS